MHIYVHIFVIAIEKIIYKIYISTVSNVHNKLLKLEQIKPVCSDISILDCFMCIQYLGVMFGSCTILDFLRMISQNFLQVNVLSRGTLWNRDCSLPSSQQKLQVQK